MQPIYDMFVESLDEESFILSEDFRLPDEKPEDQIKFAPGAMDGMIYYHMGGAGDPESDAFKLLREAIEYASNDNQEKAIEKVYEFAKGNSALSFIDLLQNYIIENKDQLPAGKIYSFALSLVEEGELKEAVKIGMTMLELFSIEDDEHIKAVVRMLGLSDEFALYSGFLMKQWKNADEELFVMAKKVRGWGRIHAIRMIENVNEEMIQWLILHGVDNDVMSSYSALDVYEKIGFAERIVDNALTLDQYRGLASILEALFDEGPVSGISAIEEKYEIIDSFLEMTVSRHDIEAEDLNVFISVVAFLDEEDSEEAKKLLEEAELFLASDRVRNMVSEAVNDGRCFQLARTLGIDYQEKLIDLFKQKPLEYIYQLTGLIEEKYKVPEILSLIEEKIDIQSIATGSADKMGLGEGYEIHRAVNYVLQQLRGHVNCGIEYIKAGLVSPVVNNRNMALSVIEAWIKKENSSLQEINSELHIYLSNIEPAEVRDDVREKMKSILDNTIDEDI